MQLEEFTFTVIYKVGAKNQNADVMSRLGEEAVVNAVEVIEFDSILSKEEILKAQKEHKTVQAIMELLKKNTTDVPITGPLKGLADIKKSYLLMKVYYIDNLVTSIVK